MIMKIYKKLIYFVAAATTLVTAQGCLEKYPGDALPEWKAMKTISDAEQSLTGIYSSFKSSALYSGYLTYLPDIQADLAYAVDGFSNVHGDIWQWNIRTTNEEVESVYAALYTIIGNCNFFLDKVDALRASLQNDEDIEYLDSWTGEVYCARALAYSELVKCYCQAYPLTGDASDPASVGDDAKAAELPGVILRLKYYGEQVAERATLKESYEQIVSDLEKAETMINEDDDAYNNVWLSRAAAHAIHARVALYMGHWDEAIKHSSEVIDSGTFRLASANTAYSGDVTYYDYLWQYDSSFEVIWKIGFTNTSYGGALGQIFLNFNNDYTYYYPDYVPASWVLNLYGSGDLRYDAYFASQRTGYAHGLTWPLLVKYYGNRNMIQSQIYHVNMPKVLRLSEQYLIRAEAYCHKSDFAGARNDLTALRKERFTAGGGNISIAANNWLDVISDERVRELYMEGFRLNDLKRWGRGFERKSQSHSLAQGSTLKVEVGDYRFVWPIPNHEIESPGTNLEQNPGYTE